MNPYGRAIDQNSDAMNRPSGQLRDELLVMAAQDGEPTAMNELVRRWQERLWRHAYRLTGQREAAWDVLQEGWLAIVRGLRRLDDPKRFRPWAYRIVTYKAADWIRRRQRDRRTQGPLDEAQPPPDRGRPDHDHVDDVDEIRAALAGLGGAQRIVLMLHYIDELPVAEIAEVLNIPPGTVKSRLHNGRAELRRLLKASD